MPNTPQTAAAPGRLAELYAQCRPGMERTAYAILGNRQDAEDAVQNAFCQLLRHADRLDAVPESEQPFWITAIVRNEARALLRRRRDTVPLEERDGTEREAGEDAAYAELVSLIRALPASYRETMEKKLLEERTDAEIAESLGISKTAVSTRVHRGRVLLRRLLHTALTAALAVLLSLGVLLAVSPAARAAAARLVIEVYEGCLALRYTQSSALETPPSYGITALPEIGRAHV